MDTKDRNVMVGKISNPIGWLLEKILLVFSLLVEGSLIVRFLLKLLGANPANNLVDFVYVHTQPLIAPFSGIFSASAPSFLIFGVIEVTVIVAFVVYFFLAEIIGKVIDVVFR